MNKLGIEHQLDLIIRIVLAGLCGGLIGYERKNKLKSAGIRTHMLVATGAALFMIVSKYAFFDLKGVEGIALDPSRIAAQVVSGIGFIGAGTILTRHNEVDGLTTATGLWVTAAIGVAIGGGLYLLGLVGVVAVLLTQLIISRIDFHALMRGHRQITLYMRYAGSLKSIEALVDRLRQEGYTDAGMSLISYDDQYLRLRLHLGVQGEKKFNELFHELANLPEVKHLEVE